MIKSLSWLRNSSPFMESKGYVLCPQKLATTVPLDLLTVTQLVKKFSGLLWNLNVYYRVHKRPQLDPTYVIKKQSTLL